MFLRVGADVYLCVFLKWVHVRILVVCLLKGPTKQSFLPIMLLNVNNSYLCCVVFFMVQRKRGFSLFLMMNMFLSVLLSFIRESDL